MASRIYLPCNGEDDACLESTRAGVDGGACLCTLFCKTERDCPLPDSGTAVPVCRPFGDLILNGHTADCRLPCDSKTVCPDGMFCSGGECWARVNR